VTEPTEPIPPQPFPLQPFLSDETVVLRAPTQAWSAADGAIGARGIHGVYFSDVRIVSSLAVSYGGEPGEVVAAVPNGADSIDFVTLLRRLDDRSADPRIRAVHRRTVATGGVGESVTVSSTLEHPVSTTITVRLGADLANMDAVKSGLHTDAVTIAMADSAAESTASWGRDAISVTLRATGARLTVVGTELELAWDVTVPAKGSTSVGWDIAATDSSAVVTSASRPPDRPLAREGAGRPRSAADVSHSRRSDIQRSHTRLPRGGRALVLHALRPRFDLVSATPAAARRHPRRGHAARPGVDAGVEA
jgi:hypothetical protein